MNSLNIFPTASLMIAPLRREYDFRRNKWKVYQFNCDSLDCHMNEI